MSSINLVKKILADELYWRTCMTEVEVEKIVNSFLKGLEDKRLVIAPAFLSDKMYDAQKKCVPDINYEIANQLYKNAIDELKDTQPIINQDEWAEGR